MDIKTLELILKDMQLQINEIKNVIVSIRQVTQGFEAIGNRPINIELSAKNPNVADIKQIEEYLKTLEKISASESVMLTNCSTCDGLGFAEAEGFGYYCSPCKGTGKVSK